MSYRSVVFALFLFAYLLSYFFRSANAVIAVDLSAELSLNASQLGLMTSLFFATFALIQLPLGSALDRFGPRWVTPGLMMFAAAGCLTFGLAQSFPILALGRAMIGLGMAGILMGGLKAFGSWYPPNRFATVASLLVGAGSAGALFAGTPLAWLNESFGWRTVFMWGAGVIVISSLAIMIWGRNAPPGAPSVSAGKQEGSFLQIIGDLRFWRIALLNLYAVGTILAVQGLWGGPYAYDVYGLSPISTGNLLLVLSIGVVIGNLASGWLADTIGRAPVIIVAGTIFTVCQLLLALAIPALPTIVLGGIYFFFGLTGAFGVVLFAHIRSIFPESMTGRAITAVNLFGIGGAMLIQWSMGLIIAAYAGADFGSYPPEAYRPAFFLTTAIGILTLAVYLPIARQRNLRLSVQPELK